MSSQDKLRVTTHPVGVTKHPAWSNNNLHLGPLLGPPSQSIKHRLFNTVECGTNFEANTKCSALQ